MINDMICCPKCHKEMYRIWIDPEDNGGGLRLVCKQCGLTSNILYSKEEEQLWLNYSKEQIEEQKKMCYVI